MYRLNVCVGYLTLLPYPAVCLFERGYLNDVGVSIYSCHKEADHGVTHVGRGHDARGGDYW